MDRKIEKKYWTTNRILMLAGLFAVLSLSIYAFAFMDTHSSLIVDADKVTISTVQEDVFQEYIQEFGTVRPIQTNYLDAIEGGVIQKVYRESGTFVDQGDTILTLANSTLQLQVMQQSSGLYDQINNVRNSRLNLEQNTLRLQEQLAESKAQMEILAAKYEREKRLYSSELISEQEFETTEKNYLYQKRRYELTKESFQKDSLQAITQLRQMNESEERMYQSLNAVQQILNNLVVTAPISGQLSTSELHQGQSIAPGERIGQVDILNKFKVRVEIDEYHSDKIAPGLTGTFKFGEKTHELMITKVYPVIKNGEFEVDMEFIGETPEGLRRGQTLRIRLEFGNSSTAVQLQRGGFIQNTGGNWIYVINEEEGRAYKRPITLGRMSPEFFEITSGLLPGEKVITSSYDTFGDKEVLQLN